MFILNQKLQRIQDEELTKFFQRLSSQDLNQHQIFLIKMKRQIYNSPDSKRWSLFFNNKISNSKPNNKYLTLAQNMHKMFSFCKFQKLLNMTKVMLVRKTKRTKMTKQITQVQRKNIQQYFQIVQDYYTKTQRKARSLKELLSDNKF